MEGNIIGVNGPVIKAEHMKGFKMRGMVMVGEKKLIGEIIILEEDFATIQVYEETSGLKIGEPVISTGSPLSLKLGPGILSNIFDGIERPLEKINEISYGFIPEGIGLISLDIEKLWDVDIIVSVGDELKEGDVYATVQETESIVHKLMVPPGTSGTVTAVEENGKYNIETTVVVLKQGETN
ncbi:MAG: V-type ATP synthase subunit A, partial [Clostridium sp.]